MGKQSSKLRELLKRPGAVISVGAWDTMSAKIIQAAGFDTVEIAGSAVSHTTIGRPDLGYITQTEMAEAARRIVQAVNIPVIADADDGFGTSLNVRRTVNLFEQAGVAGLHIEDNAMPKRCKYFGSGKLISKNLMAQNIKAAVDARKDSDLVIIARTDKHKNISLEESIERANTYAESGADMALIIGLDTVEEVRRACQEVSIPLVAGQMAGQPLILPVSELESLGYKLIFYFAALYSPAYMAAYEAATSFFKSLSEDRSRVPSSIGSLDNFMYLEQIAGLTEDQILQEQFPE